MSLGKFYDKGDSVDIAEALAILREGKTKAFNGKPDYKNIRLIRALRLLMKQADERYRNDLQKIMVHVKVCEEEGEGMWHLLLRNSFEIP